MNDIVKAVRAARRRLTAIDFVRALAILAFWTALAAAALVVVHRAARPVPPAVWAALAGFVPAGSAVYALSRRPSMRSAALALDGAADLRERLSAALFVGEAATPAARAVVRNAQEALARSGRKTVPFPKPPFKRLAIPAAALLAALLAPLPGRGDAAPTPDDPVDLSAPVPEAVRKEESAKLRRRAFHLEKRSREIEKPELKELGDEMRKIADEMRREEITKNEALARMSTLEEKARKQQEDLGQKYPDDLVKRVKDTGEKGDGARTEEQQKFQEKLSGLAKALDAAKEKLAKAEGSPEEKREAEKTMQELAEKMKEALGQDAPFSDLREKLEDMLGGLDAEDLERMERMLDGLGGALGDLEALGLLEGEMRAMAEMKGEFAEEGGTCLFCGRASGDLEGGT